MHLPFDQRKYHLLLPWRDVVIDVHADTPADYVPVIFVVRHVHVTLVLGHECQRVNVSGSGVQIPHGAAV